MAFTFNSALSRMQVFGFMTDSAITAPFPAAPRGGVKFRLLGGTIYDPRGPYALRFNKLDGTPVPPTAKPDWFNSIPAAAWSAFVRWPVLPFLSWGIGRWGGYVGFKAYGFDAPEYRDYPGVQPEDVRSGALALCFSIRLTLNRPRRSA